MTEENLPVLTVSQLTQAIKLSLESTFPHVCLQGEISNFKEQTSGHLYFSLKDIDAQISAVMFKSAASLLKIKPKGGDQVIVKGTLNVYPARGNYQLVISELAYAGIGALLQRLEELKIKLHKLGWFKKERKKPLPFLPRRIGVVTSPTGAVIQDILNILSRRFSGFHLILNPVKVQGEGAAQEIVQAIEQMNKYNLVDVLIVGRGGGSLEDLWAFNEEIVAEAIFNSRIPIICAVGHETDHSIAEYVADVRAPTPSAAAEMVMAEKAQLIQHLQVVQRRAQQTIRHLIDKNRHRLERYVKHPLLLRPQAFIEQRMQRLDDLKSDIDKSMANLLNKKKQLLHMRSQQALALQPTVQLRHFRQKIGQFELQLNRILHTQLEKKQHRLESLVATLKAIDPKNLLKKGYSILFAEKGSSIIHSIHQLKSDEKARLLLCDGEAMVTINQLKPHTKND
jgi:exodeoxyribonuclease VII large subunit